MKTLRVKILVAVLASLPLVTVYAATTGNDTPVTTVANISEITVSAGGQLSITGGTIGNAGGTFVSEIFTLNFSDNSQFGYAVALMSEHGGLLSDQAANLGAATDGEFMDLVWQCANMSAGASGVIPASGVITQNSTHNLAAGVAQNIIVVANPLVATSFGITTCSATVANAISVAETMVDPQYTSNFDSQYTFTITTDLDGV